MRKIITLIRAHGLLNCAHGLLICAHGLVIRAHGLLIRAHGLVIIILLGSIIIFRMAPPGLHIFPGSVPNFFFFFFQNFEI